MKLLKLRVEFKENTKPLEEASMLDKSILNQFNVPFRLTGKSTIILLKGDKNMNRDTDL